MTNSMLTVNHETEINLTSGEISNNLYVKVSGDIFANGLMAELGPNNFTTLLALVSFIDEKGECYPTQQTIADILGVHKNTVNKAINELLSVEYGGVPLVTRKKVNLGRGNILSYYTINVVGAE